MDISLVVDQTVNLKVAPTDADGKSREVQDIKWEVSSGDGTVAPAADGLSAVYTPSGTPGASVVTVSADADLTDGGVSALSDTANITATAVPIPPATALNLTPDEPK